MYFSNTILSSLFYCNHRWTQQIQRYIHAKLQFVKLHPGPQTIVSRYVDCADFQHAHRVSRANTRSRSGAERHVTERMSLCDRFGQEVIWIESHRVLEMCLVSMHAYAIYYNLNAWWNDVATYRTKQYIFLKCLLPNVNASNS